ncbi:MAG TPA: Ig-like domain-containing protein [Candidatus Competibacter sp.]|nr:Ig-like domain-containing protein [Candidatus Competibacter sp.]
MDTSASQSFTITVTAVDDPPTAVNDSATVTEDDPATAIDVLTNDTDLDGGPKSIVSVTQPTNGTVAITGGGAGLTYQPNADYCNAPPGSVLDTFGYTLTPGGSSATVTVTVTCVNDAPIVDLNGPASGIDFAATFTEGGGAVAIVDPAELTVSDVDNPTLASATVTIGNLLDTGMETLAATVTGTSITANYVAPTLTLTGPDSLANFQQVLRGVTYNNGSSNPNATARGITFTVDDGAAASAVATSTVTIISINSAPSFTKGADQTVNEDSGAHTVNGWATSIDDGDGNTGGQILTFQVTNNTNPTLFSAGPAISPAGVLTYTPAADANGSATITVVLKDDGGTANGGVDTSVSQSFVINVTAVNDAPSFTKGADQTVLEDAGAQTVNPWATGISAGPANEAGQTLTFNITGNTNPGLFSAGPAISSAGVLTYTPAANANGSATITVTLSDNGGTANGGVDTSASQSFTITVTAVNDAPSFAAGGNQTVNEDAGAQTVVGWATGISAGPNEAGQTLSFIITGNTNPSLFSAGPAVASNGTLTYTPAPNQNGNATITLVLMDNGGTANGGVDTSASQNFAITVNAVNDPPVATAKNYTAMANMPIDIPVGTGLIIGTTDVDNGINGCVSTSFAVSSVSATNPAGGSVVANPDGSFRFNPPPGVTGDVTFTYTVNDTGCPGPAATSAPATVTFNLSGPVIWFVDGTSGGNGTLTSPFTSFSSAATAMGTNTNQRIFIANANNQGAGTGITLPTNGWLVGQGVAGASFDAVMGISPPVGTITRPAIGLGQPTIQGTVNMNGANNHVMGLNISTSAAKGLARSNAGTINGLVVSDVGSITAVNSRAVDLSNVGIAFTATAINSSGSDVGINLVNQAGSFTVTGTGTAGSGGTVQNIANRGASFISATNITLQNMNFTNTATAAGAPCGSAAVVGANTGCNAAIHLDTVSTVTLNNLNLTISGQQGINGINVTNFNLSNSALSSLGNAPDEDGLHFHNMLGTNAITNTTIASSGDDNVNIQNLSSTASTITITGGGFNTGVLGSGLLFGSRNTADTTLNISGVTVDNNFSGGIVADGFDTARLKLKVTGSTITNNNDGIQVSANNGISQFDIDNNTLMGNDFLAITLLKAAFSTGGTLEGVVRNNNPITIANGRTTDAILIFQAGAGALKVAVTNNVINYAGTQRAILLQGGQDGNGSIDATLTGNNFDIQLDGVGNAVAGILAQNAVTGPGNTTSLCADIGGTGALKNTFTHSLGGSMGGGDIRVRQRNDGTVRLSGYGGAATDTAAVATYLNGRNTVVSPSTATFDSTGFAGGGACTQPTLP